MKILIALIFMKNKKSSTLWSKIKKTYTKNETSIKIFGAFISVIIFAFGAGRFTEHWRNRIEKTELGLEMVVGEVKEIKKNTSPELLSDNSGNVRGDTIENKLQKCDSDFKNNKWSIEGHWSRDTNNPQRFTSVLDNQFGGPKMKYEKPISDNFHLTLDFIPITNENNSENEMNLVVYVGNLYKIVVGDGNNENFYFKKDDKFISTLKKEQVLPNGKISFPNKIRFDEWVTIDIDQNIPDYSTIRTITINFFYIPHGGYKKENLERRLAGPYTFEINDSSPPDKVSREIRIGLVSSKNTIITEFKCFKLENY